ncbi:DUF2357 domain-containing protein [Luteibacter sp. PPL554]
MAALYVQREQGGPLWQVWPSPDAIPAGWLRESSSYFFELRDVDDALGSDLLIDDEPVEALRSRQPRIARWRWTPGFHAGTVDVKLVIPGGGTHRFEITTDPDLRKLTRDDFDVMVREILEDTFALFSLSAFRRGIARQSGSRPPPLARLEFLRSRVEQIDEAISAINRSPRHILRAEQAILPAHRALRATGADIVKSLRTGVIRAETSFPSRLPRALGGKLPAKIKVRTRRSSVDIPEHRQIKSCLSSWASWLSNVSELLEKNSVSADASSENKLGIWANRTRKIARKLSSAANTGFMSEVSSGAASLQLSPIFQRDPLYRRFYRLWQDMNLGLASFFGDFLQMPLAKTFELYELWCFLRLLRAATDEYGSDKVDLSSLFTADLAGGLTISSGSVNVPIGTDKSLSFQRHYREYWIEPTGEGSFSRTMVPDVVFSGTGFGDKKKRLIVLDAKYRIEDGLNDALSSIHMYRDSLVQEDLEGGVAGVVTAAYLLTPYAPSIGNDFRTARVPGRLFYPQYREKFRFGAVTLRPGMTSEDLRKCLRVIVSDATGNNDG